MDFAVWLMSILARQAKLLLFLFLGTLLMICSAVLSFLIFLSSFSFVFSLFFGIHWTYQPKAKQTSLLPHVTMATDCCKMLSIFETYMCCKTMMILMEIMVFFVSFCCIHEHFKTYCTAVVMKWTLLVVTESDSTLNQAAFRVIPFFSHPSGS